MSVEDGPTAAVIESIRQADTSGDHETAHDLEDHQLWRIAELLIQGEGDRNGAMILAAELLHYRRTARNRRRYFSYSHRTAPTGDSER